MSTVASRSAEYPPNPADLTVVREGTRNPVLGETTATREHVLPSVVWAPVPGSSEQSPRSERGQQVVTRRELYPDDPYPDVVSTDRIRFPGETGAPWSVIGDVASWVGPGDDSGPEGSHIVIERTTG